MTPVAWAGEEGTGIREEAVPSVWWVLGQGQEWLSLVLHRSQHPYQDSHASGFWARELG